MKNAYKISAFAKKQGFDLVGFAPAKPSAKAYKHYLSWLKKSFNADMAYMNRPDAVKKRKTASAILKNASSIICLAINYYHPQPPLKKDHGRIARYAYGRDYHKILKPRLKAIEEFIQKNFKTASGQPPKTKSYVDTGPLLERALAAEAGLGFIGRNSCLITKEFGSYILLAEIITDVPCNSLRHACRRRDAHKTQPVKQPHQCGTCARCINACPTKAITIDPKTDLTQIDSKKCIAYLTIEHKGPIPAELKPAIKATKRIFGCDICQEVCPHNRHAKPAKLKALTRPEIAGDSLSLAKITSLKTDKEFENFFSGSPLMRAKRKGLQRNAKAIQTSSPKKPPT